MHLYPRDDVGHLTGIRPECPSVLSPPQTNCGTIATLQDPHSLGVVEGCDCGTGGYMCGLREWIYRCDAAGVIGWIRSNPGILEDRLHLSEDDKKIMKGCVWYQQTCQTVEGRGKLRRMKE